VRVNVDDASGQMPYLLDVQANLLSDLQTRVVVPLVRAEAFGCPATRLHPRFTIAGHRLVMAIHLVAAVRRQALGTAVASLLDQHDIVISAIDVLWSCVNFCREGSKRLDITGGLPRVAELFEARRPKHPAHRPQALPNPDHRSRLELSRAKSRTAGCPVSWARGRIGESSGATEA